MSFLKFGNIAAVFALFLTAQSSFAQNFYKWVDAKGSTHYTATPPPKSAQKKGKIDTYGWKNTTPATAPSSSQAHPAVKEADQDAQNAAAEKQQVHQDAQEALRQGQAVSSAEK